MPAFVRNAGKEMNNSGKDREISIPYEVTKQIKQILNISWRKYGVKKTLTNRFF